MQGIIAESSALIETLDHVSLIAPIQRPILIHGERGSGKELIAERLHFLSPRWDAPFLKVNCAAMSEELIDSALFGHESGAFTGATRQHSGYFERADGGTLFLDELATLPLRTQEKLLRVIEYGQFERLGGRETLEVDVRLVGATHEHLPALAAQGRFRHDLLDRLAFDVIHVPPLRARKDDILPLATHFATRMCAELSRPLFPGFSADAIATLLQHSWPGNVRELKSVVERSICHSAEHDEKIQQLRLDPFHSGEAITDNAPVPAFTSDKEPDKRMPLNFSDAVSEFELNLLQQALQDCQYHQRKTAEHLGLSYHQLRALLKKYRPKLQR